MRAAGVSLAEIAQAFPARTLPAIKARCWFYGYDAPKPPNRLSDGALGAVRQRAFGAGLTMPQLDELAGTGSYFRKGTGKVILKQIAKGAAVLGGEIVIEWEPLE